MEKLDKTVPKLNFIYEYLMQMPNHNIIKCVNQHVMHKQVSQAPIMFSWTLGRERERERTSKWKGFNYFYIIHEKSKDVKFCKLLMGV